jgi:hypothetical protein
VNDADRRHSPNNFDDDAIFADIVAHLNDEATEAEQADRPSAEDGTPDLDPVDHSTDEPNQTNQTNPSSSTLPPSANPPSANPPADSPRATPGRWSIDPPSEPPAPIEPPADPAPQVWRAGEVDDEYEEHFEPAPVTPLPAGDLQFWAIIAGMTGGPLLLLYLVFFNRNASNYWILVAIAMSVGGFALLVSRMPGQSDDDDDGARL